MVTPTVSTTTPTTERDRARRRRSAGFVAAFGSILVGYDTGIIAGAMLFITPEFDLDAIKTGLIITSILIGAVIGSVVSGWVAQSLGRKRTLVISAVILAVAAIGMAAAPNYVLLLVARFVAGLGVGAVEATVPTFLSELAPTKSRGRLATNNQLMIALGILIAGVINLFFSQDLSWRFSLGIAALPSLVLFVLLLRQPETPRWLMLRGRRDDARTVLDGLLPPTEAAIAFRELDEVNALEGRRSEPTGERGVLSMGALVRSRGLRSVLAVAVFFAMLQQLVGINSILYYAPTILEKLGFGTNAALVNTVGFGLLSVTATLISGAIVDRVGRKPLLIGGSIILGAAMLVVAVVFGTGWLTLPGQILALVALAVFKAGYSLTWGPVMWVMLPELFPLSARSAGVSIATSAKIAVELVFTFVLALLLASNATVMYIVFAVFGAVAAVFVWRKIPETKGRSLEEIETSSNTTLP
ncbi:MFS transporter [Curtobacterium sp. MCSS17_008]|uniref:sugar porter family MFS transporter n=1 Tax=Curtobacterium sp. MCSS17_008 TaxID=2175647 RepID=UPI000DA912B1|nr:sugar porter family MFS transporter [Curtobacterium sp. MCSS17_008]PZF53306.1 MFS transporter [Curtobacterium sp. MCSS17_008]